MLTKPFAPTSKKQQYATVRIVNNSVSDWQNTVNFKALQFRRAREISSIKYDLKNNNAIWDPNVGPNGGWRCGTDLTGGGEFTDRYGRGCGGRVRRLLGAIGGAVQTGLPGRIGKNPKRVAETVTREVEVAVERDRSQTAQWWEAFSPEKPKWLKVHENIMRSIQGDVQPTSRKIRQAISAIESNLDSVNKILKSGKLAPKEENIQKIRGDIYGDDLLYLESLLDEAYENELRTNRATGVALSRLGKDGEQERAIALVKANTDAWRLQVEDSIANGTLQQLSDMLKQLTRESAGQFKIQTDQEADRFDRAVATAMVQFFNKRITAVQEAAALREKALKRRQSILDRVKAAARTKTKLGRLDPSVEAWLADPIVAADYLRSSVSAKVSRRGNLAAIPDEVLIEAMIGRDTVVEEVGKGTGGGIPIPRIRVDDPIEVEDILTSDAGGFPVGTKLSNPRFDFELIKNNAQRQLWTVWKVVDKDTGEMYFLKGSNMSANEAIAEIAGAEIAGLIGFPRDEKFGGIRVDKRRTSSSEKRAARWVISRHVGHYQPDALRGERLEDFKSAARVVREGGSNVTFVETRPGDRSTRTDVLDLGPEETAKITLLDYLVDNHDRHFGNFFIYNDTDGVPRIAPIDHGIVTGGEVDRGLSTVVSADQLAEDAAYRSSLTPFDFGLNVMHPVFNYVHVKSSDRIAYLDAIQELVDTLSEAGIDDLLSPERLSSKGMRLSSTEKAHLAAIAEVAKARLTMLKTKGPRLMIKPFQNRIETDISAADVASRAVTRRDR
jgi:hypothetical protein